MIIKINNSAIDVDVEKTREYYQLNSLCDCSCCRNFYMQAKKCFGKLDSFLSEFGISIERPDEILSTETDDAVMYLSVSYSVCGKLSDSDMQTVEIRDGGTDLKVVLGDSYVPNEQTGDCFIVSVYNISLPWVLDEPFPQVEPVEERSKLKQFLKKHRQS